MYTTFIVKPLYNLLIGIIDIMPWVDIGVAVIIFTIIVKLALFHLSKASLLTQVRMKEIEPEINALKRQYADDRQVQAMKIMELYRSRKIKPFSSVLLMFIQLPILLGLISVFYRIIPDIKPELLYSFVSVPTVNTFFLGLIDLSQPSLVLALLTAIAQFLQLHYSVSMKLATNSQPSTANGQMPNIMSSMNKQMKYGLPILAFVSTYWIIPAQFPQVASVIAIYWIVSSVFTLGQELWIRKKYLVSGK